MLNKIAAKLSTELAKLSSKYVVKSHGEYVCDVSFPCSGWEDYNNVIKIAKSYFPDCGYVRAADTTEIAASSGDTITVYFWLWGNTDKEKQNDAERE